MPDQPDDSQLTPDQESDVRRLLAESRHTDPVPDAVVARLDRVLADLADEPVREAAVVRLADRRRRAATMLVAAAAVIVVGVGVGQVLPQGGDDESSTSAGDAAVPESAAEDRDAPRTESESGSQSSGDLARSKRNAVRLDSRRFARDAELLTNTPAAALSDGSYSYDEGSGAENPSAPSYAEIDGLRVAGRRDICDPGRWGDGTYVAVVYEKTPGWVVLRRAQGSSQIVDLFLCGSESAVRSVTLPAP